MSLAIFPGSFDPITLGHVDIARRATTLFDDVVFALAHNSAKRYLLSLDQRADLAREALKPLGVGLEIVDGLLADYCKETGATAIIKGLRGGADLDSEQPMALINRHLAGIETVFLLGEPRYAHIASSLVKDVARHGGDVSDLVTPGVADALRDAFADDGDT